jgi:hypothetical protein
MAEALGVAAAALAVDAIHWLGVHHGMTPSVG